MIIFPSLYHHRAGLKENFFGFSSVRARADALAKKTRARDARENTIFFQKKIITPVNQPWCTDRRKGRKHDVRCSRRKHLLRNTGIPQSKPSTHCTNCKIHLQREKVEQTTWDKIGTPDCH